MTCTIREATLQDARGMIDVLNPIIACGRYTALVDTLSEDEEKDYIRRFPARGVLLVAEDDATKRIVGVQSVEPFAPYTRAFDHVGVMGTFVSLDCLRHGIGAQLAPRTFAVAKQRGIEKIFTYVRADNVGSIAFHLRLGFRIVGTAQKQARINGACVDEVIIEKFI